MNIQKVCIYITIITITIIIACPTAYKVIKENQDKRTLVTNKLIIEKAKECLYKGVCKSNKITLRELYDNKFLKDQVFDPISKSLYNYESYVRITKEDATFIVQ